MSKKMRNYRGDKALWALYCRINKAYFGDQLQVPFELKFKKMKHDGHTLFMTSGVVKVYIHEDFDGHFDVAEMILLHEMIHVHLGWEYRGSHGMRFEAEKVRLFMAGAYDKIL